MKFAALIEYLQDKAKIAEIRPVHRQYLASLREKGQLAISGPFTDDSGALILGLGVAIHVVSPIGW